MRQKERAREEGEGGGGGEARWMDGSLRSTFSYLQEIAVQNHARQNNTHFLQSSLQNLKS